VNFTTLLLRAQHKCVESRGATLALTATLGALLLCVPLLSQGNQGTIQGGVFDQTGGAIAGATVTIVDPARGLSRPLTTDTAGQYFAANLTPGAYTVRGEAKGFQTVEHPNVMVQVGQNIRVDLTLLPGAQTQTVTVTSEVPDVNTTDATLGGTVSNEEINALPLNGRNYQRLLQLRPGVVGSIGGGTGDESSNGLRGGENVTLIEGLVTQAEQSGGSVLNTSYHQGDAASLLPIDAIQEFNIEQNPKAEYGWRDGAVTNLGVKAGTNSIHGTAYAFGRTTGLDAANPFFAPINPLTGAARSPIPISLQQYGGTAGGPIVKDKAFWFLSYEKLQYSVGDAATPTIPTDLPGVGGPLALSMIDQCNALASNGTGGYNPVGTPKGVNALSAKLAGITIDPVTGCKVSPASPSFENLFPFNPTQQSSYLPPLVTQNPNHNALAKLDYNLNAKNHLSGFFFIGYNNATVQLDPGQISPIWENQQLTRAEDGNGTWVWTPNSIWVNEFRGGLALLHFKAQSVDHTVNPANAWPAGYGIVSGITDPLYFGMPKIAFGNLTGFLGQGQREGNRGPEGSANLVDHVSYLRGKHAFKFGFEYLEGIADNDPYNYGNGKVSFKSLQTFLQGKVKNGTLLVGDPTSAGRARRYAGFVQDDWRVAPRVTLNLGVRYEYNGRPFERNNYIGNFNPNANPATTPAVEQVGGPGMPAMYNAQYDNFAPRFGLAWDVQGNGKTVVRLGASIIYNGALLGELIDLNPFGANFPTIGKGINNSGTAINAHTPEQFSLASTQITWSNAGPVFPAATAFMSNGQTYTGTSCDYQSGLGGLPTWNQPPFNTDGVTPFTPTPCSFIAAVDPNYHTPWAAEWNLDVQRAITNNLTLEVAYVGNHGREANKMDINQPPIGAGWTPAAIASCLGSKSTGYDNCSPDAGVEAAAAPYAQFPYIQNVNWITNLARSNYDGLQVTVTQRASHGLTFLLGYTFSHALDMLSGGSFDNGVAADIHNVNLIYGNSDTDSRHRFTLSTVYNIPGKKAPLQMLQGWSISPIIAAFSGTPWTADDQSTDISGTGEINNPSTPFQFWNYNGPHSAFTAGPANIPFFAGTSNSLCVAAAQSNYAGNAQLQGLAMASLTDLGCYVQGSGVLTPPAYGTLGNEGRNNFLGPAYINVDLSIGKNWKFKERYSADFRVEFFNLFNRADYAQPAATDPSVGGQFGCTCQTPDGAGFTNAVLGSGAPRSMQLGLKLTF